MRLWVIVSDLEKLVCSFASASAIGSNVGLFHVSAIFAHTETIIGAALENFETKLFH